MFLRRPPMHCPIWGLSSLSIKFEHDDRTQTDVGARKGT